MELMEQLGVVAMAEEEEVALVPVLMIPIILYEVDREDLAEVVVAAEPTNLA